MAGREKFFFSNACASTLDAFRFSLTAHVHVAGVCGIRVACVGVRCSWEKKGNDLFLLRSSSFFFRVPPWPVIGGMVEPPHSERRPKKRITLTSRMRSKPEASTLVVVVCGRS